MFLDSLGEQVYVFHSGLLQLFLDSLSDKKTLR